MTTHTNDEMADDDMEILDIEHSILIGQILKVDKDDPRGTKYTIRGTNKSGVVQIETVGRFTTSGLYRIITVYAI